jgi:hypothetical protein
MPPTTKHLFYLIISSLVKKYKYNTKLSSNANKKSPFCIEHVNIDDFGFQVVDKVTYKTLIMQFLLRFRLNLKFIIHELL